MKKKLQMTNLQQKTANDHSKLVLSRKLPKKYQISDSCVILITGESCNSLIRMVPLKTQKSKIRHSAFFSLTKPYKYLQYGQRFCDTKIFLFLDRPPSLQSFRLPVVMPFLPCISSSERRQEISTSLNFFLFEYIFSAFFQFKNLKIVLTVFPSL